MAGELRRVVGTISMDAFAVELDRELPVGTPVTLLGDGVLAEAHARVAGTIGYELADRDPQRRPSGRAARSSTPRSSAGAGSRSARRAARPGPGRAPARSRRRGTSAARRARACPTRPRRRAAWRRALGRRRPGGRSGSAAPPAAGSPRSRRSPGSTVCTWTPRGAEQAGERARERELRVLRRGVRPGRRERDRARDRDDVDDVRARLQARQEGARAPDAAEVVRPQHRLDPLRLEREEVAAAGDARVVDEQVDPRVPLEDRRGRAVDLRRGRRRRRPRTRRRARPRAARAALAGARRARSASRAARAPARSPRRSRSRRR